MTVWHLRRGDELLGTITITDGDFPWLSGRFAPEPGFAEFAPLFAEELALLESEDWEAWEAAYDRISGQLTLVAPDGPVAEFLLHVQGDEAWFRWSDEPFDQD
ncbi:hypothetical protein Lesp02_19130 [Lentzea sp. NBRC 105346]|uniref:hypothetical protein n=1 Tax=Lentzea sp. NBRC 105346 TaxID=3032205 RepID=UPI00249FB694|nr:hypothetical protein [Lentzea sp. NBRC 105346]GLZ29723.1 hypothetical protein Lesp02_19130 [Lentzea sp. NBRC 105346]